MDVKSIEISKSLLELLRNLPEDEVKGFVDALRFDVAERASGEAAALAEDGGAARIAILHDEDGAATILTLKLDAL